MPVSVLMSSNYSSGKTLLEIADTGLKLGPDNYTGDILTAVRQYAEKAMIIAEC